MNFKITVSHSPEIVSQSYILADILILSAHLHKQNTYKIESSQTACTISFYALNNLNQTTQDARKRWSVKL